jgi:hypothetical protein
LISNFDTKLLGGLARDHLNSLHIHCNAVSAHHQDGNGLAERHWQTVIAMARNWLASAELPARFWFYAVMRAAEVCNYFPIKLDVVHGLCHLNSLIKLSLTSVSYSNYFA